LYGSRETKYKALLEQDVSSTKWTRLKPGTPTYLLKPQSVRLRAEYERGWKLTAVMPVSSVGIVTARDELTIHFTEDELWRTVREFARLDPEKARERYGLPEDVRDWKVHLAQEDLRRDGPSKDKIVEILYRPFDIRFTYYTGRTRGFHCRPRPDLARHLLRARNIALCVGRSGHVMESAQWEIAWCSRHLVDFNLYRRGGNCVFPLYLYPDGRIPDTLFEYHDARRPNLSAEFIADASSRLKLSFVADGRGDLKKTFGPEDIFHYIYAVLHSPTYRKRYGEFLKLDFPRVPLTSNRRLFACLSRLGCELVPLHLLEAKLLELVVLSSRKLDRRLAVKCPVAGANEVAKGHPRYLAAGQTDPHTGDPLKRGRVYINSGDPKRGIQGQYIEGVPPEVWEFRIGGYQVCQKWLKDRQGRLLTYDDLTHYQKIILALKETIRLMEEIDQAVPRWPLE
jgi:hypothetical protein